MQAFFLQATEGQRFCIHHPVASGTVRGAVIYLHPFAEEMNKSRRMAAMQARAMAGAGYEVLQIDLFGCGDSSGDFGCASWSAWLDDVALAWAWLRQRGNAPMIFWGLRAGCLLAAEAAAVLPEAVDFVFWQPVVSGKQHWQQFMRLKMAGELASGAGKGVSETLRQQLGAGHSVEIAGYAVSPGLVKGLEKSELQPVPEKKGRVAWLELSSRDDATLGLASQRKIDQWQQAGYAVNSQLVTGPAFWQTSEIEEAPALLAASLAMLERW